jgi:hypothetical protein
MRSACRFPMATLRSTLLFVPWRNPASRPISSTEPTSFALNALLTGASRPSQRFQVDVVDDDLRRKTSLTRMAHVSRARFAVPQIWCIHLSRKPPRSRQGLRGRPRRRVPSRSASRERPASRAPSVSVSDDDDATVRRTAPARLMTRRDCSDSCRRHRRCAHRLPRVCWRCRRSRQRPIPSGRDRFR